MEDEENVGEAAPQPEEEVMERKIVAEQYKAWKHNSVFLYDLLLSTAMEWPTLTTQWFPDKQDVPDKPYTRQRLLMGTHTSDQGKDYLQIATVQIPKSLKPDAKDYNEESGEIGGYGAASTRVQLPETKVNIVQRIDHPGEINRARYQPQNPNVIATMCTDGRLMIWDKSKHPSTPTGQVNPEVELLGHEKEGFGLSWSPHEYGHLASASEDATLRLWDITQSSKTKRSLTSERTYTHHSATVNDVEHHPIYPSLIGTVSDDLTMQIIDIRSPETTRGAAVSGPGQHLDAINAIAFNPSLETVVATGSADKTISIWDLRNLKNKLHALEGHLASVTGLAWNPFEMSILGSSSYDRRIVFWDLAKVGEEQSPEDSEDGPPELLFIHGGHTNRITDFSWNLHEPWMICSADDDNIVQVWRVADAIVGGDEEDIRTGDLET